SPDQGLSFVTFGVVVVLFVLGANLLRGRTGRAIVAIRDNPIAAQAMGVNGALYKSLTFGVSAAYTGVAGALSALAIALVAPDARHVFPAIASRLGRRHLCRTPFLPTLICLLLPSVLCVVPDE